MNKRNDEEKENKKKYTPKTTWGKVIYYFLRFVMGTVYYATAIIVSIAIVIGAFAFFGYYSYNNYYQKYLDVQASWIAVDNEFNNDLISLSKNYATVNNYILENSEELNSNYITELKYIKDSIINADEAMSYTEKISSYPYILSAANDLKLICKDLNLNDEYKTLAYISQNNQQLIDDYNEKATEWNTESLEFPLDIISEIASFHKWQYFK